MALCLFSVTVLASDEMEAQEMPRDGANDSRPDDNETPFYDPLDANEDDAITAPDAALFLRQDKPDLAAEVLQKVVKPK